jgi:hypothetical protein
MRLGDHRHKQAVDRSCRFSRRQDDHITGVLSEHQAGKFLGVRDTGIKIKGHRSTPGRYFKVAHPGTGWGGTDLTDPLTILKPFDKAEAWPGLRMLMVSTTGEHSAYYELNGSCEPVQMDLPPALARSVERIAEIASRPSALSCSWAALAGPCGPASPKTPFC